MDVHFCPQCTKILTLGRHGDYFSFLGLPRKLNLDVADLEQRFRALSRQFHPDFFYNATPAERRASLERSSYLNDAYRTLRQPMSRIEYLLDLEGLAAAQDAGKGASNCRPRCSKKCSRSTRSSTRCASCGRAGAPPELWKRGSSVPGGRSRPSAPRTRSSSRSCRAAGMRSSTPAEATAIAGRRSKALRERMLERNYINNLLAGIERELERN